MTLTVTTAKRLHYFVKVWASIRSCLDWASLDKILIIDDGSSASDVSIMQSLMAESSIPYTIVTGSVRGHQAGLRLIRLLCSEDIFIFHTEDDVLFAEPAPYISNALAVLAHDPKVGNVCVGHHRFNRTGPLYTTSNGVQFGYFTPDWHPHYSIVSSVVRMAAWNAVGDFPEAIPLAKPEQYAEWRFGLRSQELGWKTAWLPLPETVHLEEGPDQSAYYLNRSWR